MFVPLKSLLFLRTGRPPGAVDKRGLARSRKAARPGAGRTLLSTAERGAQLILRMVHQNSEPTAP